MIDSILVFLKNFLPMYVINVSVKKSSFIYVSEWNEAGAEYDVAV